jgi:hypothetical protein
MVDEFSGLGPEVHGGSTISPEEHQATLTRLFGNAALSNADAFFAHITSENDTLWPAQAGNWTEGEYSYLSVLSDHPTFKQDLFAAIQRPDFANLLSGDGGGDFDLEALMATPGGQDAIVDIVARIAADDFDGNYAALTTELTSRVTVASMAELREEMRGMEPAARFAALRDNIVENGGPAELVTALNGVDPTIQEALGNAFAYNDQFATYIVERMTPTAEGAAATTDFASLLQNIPADATEAAVGILNIIAQDPSYDMSRLDGLVTAVTNHADLVADRAEVQAREVEAGTAAAAAKEAEIADLDRRIEEASTAMLTALRDAGGNVPALAGMNSTMMMAFMMDLVNGTGTDGAIANLGAALNLSPEQLEAMQELIAPFAGIIEFMVEPYAALYQEHGVAIMDAFGRTQERVNILTNPDQAEFDEATAAAAREAAAGPTTPPPPVIPADFGVPADTGNVVDFGAAFARALNNETSVEAVLDALVEADSELADEVAAIRSDADLMGQFTTWSGMMTSEEVAAASATELYANFNRDVDLRTAVNSTPGLGS